MQGENPKTYGQINDRLKEIIDQVSDESMPLDNALDLLEEAVRLGVQASSLLEEDISARNASQGGDGQDAGTGRQGAAPEA